MELASVLFARGFAHLEFRQDKEALADLGDCIDHLLLLHKARKLSNEGRQSLWVASYLRSTTLGRLKRHREAIADWDRVVEYGPLSKQLVNRLHRADCLARAGEHQRAMSEAISLAAVKGQPPASVWYSLARIAALSSRAMVGDPGRPLPWRERFAELAAREAARWLHAAHKAGYFKAAANVTQVKKDPDLAALRGRADFKRFLEPLKP